MKDTASAPLTIAPAARRGFGPLPCPRCGNDASVRLDLAELDVLACGECEEEFSVSEVRMIVRYYAPLLRWIDDAPQLEE